MQSRHPSSPVTQDLLRTKLMAPRLSTRLVPRTALLARLDQGLDRKLTLIAAPAGYGKTTLAGQWLVQRSQRPDHQPVAWLALDAGDNDPVRFWRYLFTACQTLGTGDSSVGSEALALLHQPGPPPFEAILISFINDLALLAGPAILVLEDYHVIEARQIHEMMVFLLDHLPTSLHLVMLTRQDPPFPLARLRARHELHELGPLDLRFSTSETEAFLRQTIPFLLSPEVMDRLGARAEGWAAGLRLVALALQARQDQQEIEQFLLAFTGSHTHIVEYLAEEVLHAQPEPLRTFLLQTAFLDRLTASLCYAVTNRSDSAQLLEQLARAQLFLIPLDEAGQWYRYHGLFAEAMRHYAQRHPVPIETDPMDQDVDGERVLYARASDWYEAHGLLAEAVEFALAAQAYTRAAALIERLTQAGRYREPHTLRRWIEQLPEDLLRHHPGICLSFAGAILYTQDRGAPATAALLEKPLQMAEASWQQADNKPRLGQLYAFRTMVTFWQGEFSRCFTAARQALDLLPAEDVYWRGISQLFAALERVYAGEMHAAREAFLEARRLCEVARNDRGVRAAIIFLIQVCIEQGELQQAEQLARQVLAEAGDDRVDQCHALTDLARLAYARNDLDTIDAYLTPALDIARQHAAELGEQFALETLIVPAALVQAQVEHARGETGRARQALQALLAETQISPLLRRQISLWQARLALADADRAAVERWRAAYDPKGEATFLLFEEREARLRARILIAGGDLEAALRLLAPWQARAQAGGRTMSELETLLVMALAHHRQGDAAAAKQALERALTLAHASGCQRPFLDEGEAMVALLKAVYPDVRGSLPLAAFARSLLLAFAKEPADLPAPPAAYDPLLVEPLSPQEERVLRLVAAGLSNPDIARELVVSLNTVKSHVKSIFRKLDVNSRDEARARARHLHLR